CIPSKALALAVRRVQLQIARNLAFPTIPVREQHFLVVVKFFAGLRRILEVWPLHDGIHRACFLTEPAIDAFYHVDVVACGAAASVFAWLCLDRDGERRAHGLAQLAGDAALFAVRITSKRMLTAKARTQGAFLKRVVERRLRLEEITYGETKGLHQLPQEDRTRGPVEECHALTLPFGEQASPMSLRRRPRRAPSAETPSSRDASTGHSGNGGRSLSPWRKEKRRTRS